MTTATGQRVVFEFNAGPYYEMAFYAFVISGLHTTGVFQVRDANGNLLSDAASIIEGKLNALPDLSGASVTIGDETWRVEVTYDSSGGPIPLSLFAPIIVMYDQHGASVLLAHSEERSDPEPEGNGGALTNVDAGDETPPEDQPDPEPEDQSDPEPEGDGAVEEAQPETWIERQLQLANADDSGAYSSHYELYWDDDPGGEFQLQFGDETTGVLPPNATAAAIDAALESLDGVADAEVTGVLDGWTLAITADTEDILRAIEIGVGFVDDNLGNLQLDYIGGNLQLDYI